MELSLHTMTNLFAQLGLASEPSAIESFIAAHRPLPASVALHEAAFWTAAQADFLRAAISDDADWAEVIDRLNAGLREPWMPGPR